MTEYQDEQRKLDVQTASVKIMSMVCMFESLKLWVNDNILSPLYGTSDLVISDAISFLVANKLAERNVDDLFATIDGKEWLKNEIKKPDFDIGSLLFKFREEALTGTDCRGKQSKITRAALPSISVPIRDRNRVEDNMIDHCSAIEQIAKIAASIGMQTDECAAAIETGEVHICRGIAGSGPHYGRFHRGGGKSGNKWQHICIACAKTTRK